MTISKLCRKKKKSVSIAIPATSYPDAALFTFLDTKHSCCGRQAEEAMASWRRTDRQIPPFAAVLNSKYKIRFVTY